MNIAAKNKIYKILICSPKQAHSENAIGELTNTTEGWTDEWMDVHTVDGLTKKGIN